MCVYNKQLTFVDIIVFNDVTTEVSSSPLSVFIIIIIVVQASGFDCSPLVWRSERARAVIRDVSMLDLLIKS